MERFNFENSPTPQIIRDFQKCTDPKAANAMESKKKIDPCFSLWEPEFFDGTRS